ncbi:hypothetical protein CN676_12090 [Bacillus wiedmannii]|uniref:hypothetical protein n=2 Tax=Bacillus wiedmannii TaxID=1890302 RepID=UPI000BEB8376|nr:hypothetical protein [Bacillus wiedmannii]PEA78017.1 hypothetical protein CON92_09985 [Bacillus wiedmannii]PEJ51279.1 hypothetical protein CN676_12090 [Bacillus wiedmannii]PEL43191.1 hypothetical protein CN607_08760 [Bacillus wiedmannii]PEO75126.1 hypothetical protein CN572_05345 [Bacillus wiedmannii]PEO99513.1 hypothetical protein CN554_07785 [Bacillus wiedmannii]
MIKLEIAKDVINRVRKNHLKSFRRGIKSDIIDQQQLYFSDRNYVDLLMYIDQNIDKILCGDLNDLKIIIEHIEKNYYISTNKLSKIKQIKKTEIVGDKSKFFHDYVIKKNLQLHLAEEYNDFRYIKCFKESIKILEEKWAAYDVRLSELFNYKRFIEIPKSEKDWKAYDLVEQLNISICPYCNRQYINTLNSNGKRARAVLDHFYAKSLYPYLAVSVFNLIPCCYFCNSTFKGDKDFYNNEPLYPYKEGFSKDAKFETDFDHQVPYDYKYLLGISDDFKINIKIVSKDNDIIRKINQSNSIFYLEDMYAFHKEYVRDLIRSSVINNKSRIDEIYESYPGIFKNRQEVVQMLFINYFEETDLGKRTLSKLTKDIIEEFLDIDEMLLDE